MVEILGDGATSAEVREVEANARDLVALVRSPSARSKGGRGGGTEEESGARERDGPAALLVSRAGQRGAGGRTTIDSILWCVETEEGGCILQFWTQLCRVSIAESRSTAEGIGIESRERGR